MFGFSAKYRFSEDDGRKRRPAPMCRRRCQRPPAGLPQSYLVFFDFNKSDLTPQAVSIVDTRRRPMPARRRSRS
jgi:hypothetical protein